jgi:hypothetical protein
MHRLIMAVGVAVATCLALGCGSSGSETTSAPLTKAEFIRQADAICAEINREEQAAAVAWKKEYPGGVTEAEAHPDEALRAVVVPYMQRKADELKALEPPAKDEAAVARMIDNLSQASKTLKEDGFESLPRSGALEFRQEAMDYGLKSCGGRI